MMTRDNGKKRPSPHLNKTLWLVTGLVLAGMLLFAVSLEANRQERVRLAAFHSDLADLARIYEAVIGGKLQEYDDTLLVLREAYSKDPNNLGEYVRLLRSGPLADREILVVQADRHGNLEYTDTPGVKPGMYLGDRQWFRFFADGGRDLMYIDQPTFGRVTKRYTLPLSRAMYNKEGEFLGVIAISVKQQSLVDFGPRLQLSGDTAVTIVNKGGALVSRSRDLARLHGTRIPPGVMAQMLPQPEGIFTDYSSPDGKARIIAYRHVSDEATPLILYVEGSPREVLQQTSLQRRVLVGGAVFTSMVIMALWVVYLKGRKTSVQLIDTLRRSKKQEYETLTGTTLDGFFICDGEGRILDTNDTLCRMAGCDRQEILGRSVAEFAPGDSPEQLDAQIRQAMTTGSTRFQSRLQSREGRGIDVEISAQFIQEPEHRFFVFVRDITEIRQAEEQRRAHLAFLENLERVDGAMKLETNPEQMLWKVVQTVFAMFACDRAWLLYPCNPDAPSFRVPVEVTGPEYPGAKMLNEEVPMSPAQAENMREALEADGPLTFAEGTDRPITTAKMFGVRSQMFIALFPRLGEPWVFGMHQCSFARIWTEEEKNLFQEIGRRLADGLSSVLYLRELQENEQRFRATFEQAAVGIAQIAADGRWLRVNRKLCDIVGYTKEELLGKSFQDITHPDDLDPNMENVRRVLAGEIPMFSIEKRYIRKDGSIVWIYLTVSIVRHAFGDHPEYFISVVEDITERKRAEEDLRRSEGHLRTLVQTIPDLVWLKDKDGVYLSCNQVFERLYGAREAEIVGKTDYDFVDRELADFFVANDRKAIAAGKPTSNEEWVTFADDGHRALLDTIKTPMYDSQGELIGVLGIAHDITARKRAEEANARLEAQLQQAQKMEAIGQLAGGVAHDFNNMLGVILGHTELAMDQVEPGQPIYQDLEEIHAAAERSTDIARQLLAFARKQTTMPKVIDLNEMVEALLKMLRRLIGEDIDLNWVAGSGLWPVKMDPSQIDQILANLCVNARGAIAGVGKITVETANITFDAEYCAINAGFIPGDFVRLEVSDNGCGMSKETLCHIFEPFFTTKVVGEGTGLGLATVYGAVKQNNGFINVYSEPGKGTTFKIYLPRHKEKAAESLPEAIAEEAVGGEETILLVEDEPTILTITRTMLQRLGYAVLPATNPLEAIDLAATFAGTIDLLLTDVIMPGMNGRDLAEKLQADKPGLKCLFMSGYTADIIASQGVLDEKVSFIQKPFSRLDLAAKVRQVLDVGNGR
jgi:PAS domain S-box-containing protein